MDSQEVKQYQQRKMASFSRMAAEEMVPILVDELNPQSVLDVGCGFGEWLEEFKKRDVQTVVGVDGEYIVPELTGNEVFRFIPTDLEKPFDLSQKFDLVMSIEVGEHLNRESADSFIESLCKHSDNILFSAAVPGQEGIHHVNEEWPMYWIEKFKSQGYFCYDYFRWKIWDSMQVAASYKNNILFFSKTPNLFPNSEFRFVIHPELYAIKRGVYLNGKGF
jgi:SAM-dependent methyltransferase